MPLHPADPGFAEAYGRAWSSDPEALLQFFAPAGIYRDIALDGTYHGREGVGRFHRFMLAFAPDSVIEFGDTWAADGRLTSHWIWSGTAGGPLKLRSGKLVDLKGKEFSVPGIAACAYDSDGLVTLHEDFWDLATVLDRAGIPVG
ncbi:hypothetical protein AD006_31820 (plasmid) [Pseudonocardia sp. EC080610-09]|uniref:nuclear transport factor 2 family protein n=1 Tax=unclassified Pseudonocardia TaxID=2619320 RepID=UPI00070603CA|nr:MULTISPECIES: nuclear transport factor 2 family protein [unclassified Pseudonocardia]ALL79726.1 hypothetical protein AD006_31820 [Pseudonocardia sp. EC080610-09]ALL85158.1 hypothetical protein AD017_28345 [Pseudonocardia sp. EC080619-01]